MRQKVALLLWAVAASSPCGQPLAGTEIPASGGPRIIDDPLYVQADLLWRAGQHDQVLDLVRPQAEQGNPAAQHLLGVFYAHGRGVPQDDERAVYWWRKAAQQGAAKAQNELGVMLASGSGVERDYVEAVDWFRKSAEQGLALAQANLGGMYANGFGVRKDAKEAVAWYRRAAEQGLSWAQISLGDAYRTGAGITGSQRRREEQAIQWYRRAADQDYAEAQFALGRMYYGGNVRVDWGRAVYWLARAAHNGHGMAAQTLPRILPVLTRKRTSAGTEILAGPDASAAVVRTAHAAETAYELARLDGWLEVYLAEGHTLGYIPQEPQPR